MINVIDLFAGCGGLTEGFEMSGGYNLLAAVEWDMACCNTLRNRLETKWGVKNTKNKVMYFDIQRWNEMFGGWGDDPKFGTHVGLDSLIGARKVDMIIGGPPCQSFSLAGRIRDKDNMHNDYRNYLFESYVKVVEKYKPDVFVFENVIGILSAKPGGVSIIDRIYEQFDAAGYQISKNLREQAVFNVANYGVPQNRKRVIIYGVNKKLFKNPDEAIDGFYKELRLCTLNTKITVGDAILDLPKFFPNPEGSELFNKKSSHSQTIPTLSWHIPRFHSERDIKIFRMLAEDIKSGRRQYTSTEQIKILYSSITGKTSNVHKYYVLREDEQSNTIPAHLHKDGLRHIHPDPQQARTITVREAARLQSFPDDFDFIGSQSDAYKMIGNAVPPLFANNIADVVRLNLKEYSK